mgnify:CR=1 FL=1
MKLLIRTVTFGGILFFMTLIVLHCTTVEVTKQQINSASVNALYRTIDAYQENQKLIDSGDTSNLYFVTDQDYYNYFYDSLMVQLNGKMKVTVTCNETNVENGDLDVDITANYRAVGKDIKEHTFHVDTYGRIKKEVNYTEEQRLLNRKLAEAPAGQKIEFAGKKWLLVEDKTDTVTLLLDENAGAIDFGSSEKYSMSPLEFKNRSFMDDTRMKENSFAIENATLNNLNTLNGLYTENGTDEASGQVFSLSQKQAKKLKEKNVQVSFWTRTAADYNKVYYYNNGTLEVKNVSEQFPYRPAISVIKSKINRLIIDGDVFKLDTTKNDKPSEYNEENVLDVGWDERNEEILRTLNGLEKGTYKISALVTLKTDTIDEDHTAKRGDQYGMKLNDSLTLYSYNEIILNSPVYFEKTITIDEEGSFNDLRLYGCGSNNEATGKADFTKIKIEKLY